MIRISDGSIFRSEPPPQPKGVKETAHADFELLDYLDSSLFPFGIKVVRRGIPDDPNKIGNYEGYLTYNIAPGRPLELMKYPDPKDQDPDHPVVRTTPVQFIGKNENRIYVRTDSGSLYEVIALTEHPKLGYSPRIIKRIKKIRDAAVAGATLLLAGYYGHNAYTEWRRNTEIKQEMNESEQKKNADTELLVRELRKISDDARSKKIRELRSDDQDIETKIAEIEDEWNQTQAEILRLREQSHRLVSPPKDIPWESMGSNK